MTVKKASIPFGKTLALGLAAVFGWQFSAEAHVRQRIFIPSGTGEGQESIVAWSFTTPTKVSMQNFSGTLGNGSTIDSSAAADVFATSIAQWLAPYHGMTPNISLDLSSGKPYGISSGCEYNASSSSKTDGIHNMLFTSKINSSCATALTTNSGVIGLTKTRFNSQTGEIVEADIQFDDTTFRFTTSGNNDINPTTGPKIINLHDVVTHEFGHFLGLDHSSVRNSTMLFAVADDLQTNKDDDKSGILSLYPPATGLAGAAQLSGSVVDKDSKPIFGAMVYVLDARRLTINSSDFTNSNGAFEFCAIQPGPQVIFTNSYMPFGSNVHEYYTGSDGQGKFGDDANVCDNPGCEFMTDTLTHSFFADAPTGTGVSGGLSLREVELTAGNAASFVNLKGLTTTAEMEDVPGSVTPGDTQASVIDFDAPRAAFLATDDLGLAASATNVGTDAYRFTVSTAKTIRISTAALTIYSRLKLQLSLFSDATAFATDIASTCTGQATPTVNLARDPYLVCDLTAGDYIVKVNATTASCKDVPGNSRSCEDPDVGESASTSRPLYLITIVDNTDVDTAKGTGVKLDATSAAATTYNNLPTCGSKSKSVSTGAAKGGCCGTLNDMGGKGPRGPQTLLLSLIFNPAFLFGLYWTMQSWLRRRMRAARVKNS